MHSAAERPARLSPRKRAIVTRRIVILFACLMLVAAAVLASAAWRQWNSYQALCDVQARANAGLVRFESDLANTRNEMIRPALAESVKEAKKTNATLKPYVDRARAKVPVRLFLAAFVLSIGFGLFWLAHRLSRRIRGLEQGCPNCAYDLTGNASGRCPECGSKAAA